MSLRNYLSKGTGQIWQAMGSASVCRCIVSSYIHSCWLWSYESISWQHVKICQLSIVSFLSNFSSSASLLTAFSSSFHQPYDNQPLHSFNSQKGIIIAGGIFTKTLRVNKICKEQAPCIPQQAGRTQWCSFFQTTI